MDHETWSAVRADVELDPVGAGVLGGQEGGDRVLPRQPGRLDGPESGAGRYLTSCHGTPCAGQPRPVSSAYIFSSRTTCSRHVIGRQSLQTSPLRAQCR